MSSASTPVAIHEQHRRRGGECTSAPRSRFRCRRRTPTDLANRDRRSRLGPARVPSSSSPRRRAPRRASVPGQLRPCWSTGRSPRWRPRDDVRLRVRVTGNDGVTSDWSEPLRIRAGFLAEGEWVATPIGLAEPVGRGAARTGPDRVRDRRGRGLRGALRDRSRGLPGQRQRRRRRRPGPQAGLDAVPVAAHPRDHRRDRPAGPRDQRARHPFRRRLGHRAVRLPRPGRTLLLRPARRGGPAGDHVRGRPPAGGGHRRDLAGLHGADHGQRDLPR